MNNNYYVYIYYRLDTNEPFYVGKGKGSRWKNLNNRKGHFKNIINKTDIACEIYKDNLTENEAHGIECWLIHELVFEYGFSINIKRNNSIEKGCHLVNQTWGGEGTSGKECWFKNLPKENHPFYGKHHSDEVKEKMSEKAKMRVGELNPMYGKHHTEEVKKKISEYHKGKKDTKETKKKKSESHKGKKNVSLFYGKNPNAKYVICITTKRIFSSAKEGSEFYKISRSEISSCCKGWRNKDGKRCKVRFAGKLPDGTPLVWRKLIWKHNKKYRIIK